MSQDKFFELLRKKGVGPTMSKHLTLDELSGLNAMFQDPDISLTSKATLITAFKFLENTPEEQEWYDQHRYLPLDILYSSSQDSFLIQAYHGITQNTSFTTQEMYNALSCILDPKEPEFVKAAFLEALRLRRETQEENEAALSFFLEKTNFIQTSQPLIIDLANPYDGFNRFCILPFIAVVMATLGYPTVLHGVDEVGPKYGMTTSKMLKVLGYPRDYSLEQATEKLLALGFTYVDQSVFFPSLYALKTLRRNMLKRPLLATIEKLLLPIRAKKNYILTSYTHPPYKLTMSNLLKVNPIYENWMMVRGQEGSIQLPMDRRCPVVTAIQDTFSSPEDYDLEKQEILLHFLDIHQTIDQGIKALSGEKNLIYYHLLYQCSVLLSHITGISGQNTIKHVMSILESGDVLHRFNLAFKH